MIADTPCATELQSSLRTIDCIYSSTCHFLLFSDSNDNKLELFKLCPCYFFEVKLRRIFFSQHDNF